MAISTDTTASWPPSYSLRRSDKARNTFLQVNFKTGLEIVIPSYKKTINIEKILNDKRAWIEKMLFKYSSFLMSHLPLEPKPEKIDLKSIQETWTLLYQKEISTSKIKLLINTRNQNILLLKGNTDNHALCKKLLIKWLYQKAKQRLIPWLHELSIKNHFSYNRAIIRGQNTLWGSCNAKKNISLNYKLLFLPRALAEHVLLHELCHTRYLNHSALFWELFAKADPNVYENKRLLKTAEHYLPGWITV